VAALVAGTPAWGVLYFIGVCVLHVGLALLPVATHRAAILPGWSAYLVAALAAVIFGGIGALVVGTAWIALAYVLRRGMRSLGDPAAFFRRIVIVYEIRDDLCDQSFEALIPAVLLGVEDTMAVDDPAHVTWLVPAQEEGLGKLQALVEDAFYGLHGLKEASLVPFGKFTKHLGDLLARAAVE
jgi:hypothetical protein